MNAQPDTAPAAHQPRPPETWAQARDEYLAGDSAPEVCARHGLALSTFRHRAKIEGWRRADDAWEGLVRSIRKDRPRDAYAWLRLYQALRKFAREERLTDRAPLGARAPVPLAPPDALPATPEAVEDLDLEDILTLFESGAADMLDQAVVLALFDRAQALDAASPSAPLDELDDLDSVSCSPTAAEERLAA